MEKDKKWDIRPMFNAYPDSIGGKLAGAAELLGRPEFQDTFGSFYILPSLFHSDLDRGFSVIDYGINEELAAREDLEALKKLGISLKLDFILNHASVQSPQFRDLLENGEESVYKDFFIDWNLFWENHGTMTSEGYIEPDAELIREMFFRKPGLPILMVEFPDGKKVPYWNTFYQKVWEEGGKTRYLGQMDLNEKSDMVWKFYEDTLDRLQSYGAGIVRLDAFAYLSKEVGKRNFLNEPETWEILWKLRRMADERNLQLLPEIHASYEEKKYSMLAEQGYMIYDFFLPGLIIDALENHSGVYLKAWAEEIIERKLRTVNMLGCHDGIPMLDLRGILSEERIQALMDRIVERGGYIKNLHGNKKMYYQVNATYYSALGEDDKKLLLARALQLFMPGRPQVWYLDLFAGKNDHEAVKRAGADGHKEINRTNLNAEQIESALQKDVVKKQLELLQFRSRCDVFASDSEIEISCENEKIFITWKRAGKSVCLKADLRTCDYEITEHDGQS